MQRVGPGSVVAGPEQGRGGVGIAEVVGDDPERLFVGAGCEPGGGVVAGDRSSVVRAGRVVVGVEVSPALPLHPPGRRQRPTADRRARRNRRRFRRAGAGVQEQLERVRAVPRVPRRAPQDRLHDQRDRAPQRPVPQSRPASRTPPERASSDEVLYLVATTRPPNWKNLVGRIAGRKHILHTLTVHYGDRIEASTNERHAHLHDQSDCPQR